MKRLILTLATVFVMLTTQAQNPFLEKYNTPHNTPPFDKIKTEHYYPAIQEGMKQHLAEIDAIVKNQDAPTFQNTIVALEHAGELLDRITTVFGNLLSAETNDEMEELAQQIMPELTQHGNKINLNEELFKRVKAVYEQKEKLNLNTEDAMLLQETYDNFVRSGANLNAAEKEKYRELSTKASMLGLQFNQNNLKETNEYEMLLTDKAQLSGLPASIVDAAAHAATSKGKEGWLITLQAPSYSPFMMYCNNRELRKELYMAYNTKCTHDNETNTLDVVRQIVNTSMEKAQLLGYDSYADFKLDKRMAEKTDNVYNLLNQLLEAYAPTAKKEYQEVQEFARASQGADFVLMPWDWSYYSQKLKNHKFNIDDEMLRPYFELSKVKEGVFGLATTLYGITFKENKEIPVYHPDVDAYEVYDKDGTFLSVLYTDFHPRAGKRAGAWMTSFKSQWKENGVDSRPHVSITMNFTQPTADKPALLTYDEVDTFLHEFGHALHGMLTDCTYSSLSGTNTYWDFVELPSQIMQNFTQQKEFLNTFATHYQTGEQIPGELIERIKEASNFNAGYVCLRQLSFGLLDMAWYTRTTPFTGDVLQYEKEAFAKTQILPTVAGTCMSAQFGHIFSGGYAAGYYSYKWAEVLDADAFSMFLQKGLFNKEVAESFRRNILAKGSTEHPMTLYKRFRGQEPTIDALLIRNGIK